VIERFFRTPRVAFAALFALCAALLGFGMFLQLSLGLEPCPMCIMQRYALVVCGLIAAVAALHGPTGTGRRIYTFAIALAALAGGGVAARQSWLQHFPPKVVDCGPDLEFMLDSFPLTQALPLLFRGTGDCAKVQWSLLGLSIAEWSLVWFILIAIANLALALRSR
jgi:disulfide bond formation protein DsbB